MTQDKLGPTRGSLDINTKSFRARHQRRARGWVATAAVAGLLGERRKDIGRN
jgi:hypothetical protein